MREGFETNYGHVTTYALVVVELILILKMIKLQCTHLLWLQLGLLFNMKENPDVSQVPDMIFSIHGHLLLLLYLFAASSVSTHTHTHTLFSSYKLVGKQYNYIIIGLTLLCTHMSQSQISVDTEVTLTLEKAWAEKD